MSTHEPAPAVNYTNGLFDVIYTQTPSGKYSWTVRYQLVLRTSKKILPPGYKSAQIVEFDLRAQQNNKIERK